MHHSSDAVEKNKKQDIIGNRINGGDKMGYQLIARKLADRIYLSLDNRDYYDVVAYGMEIAISTICNILFVLLLAWKFDILSETFVFAAFFIPLRMVSGGVHANSHGRCILAYVGCQLLAIYIGQFLVPGRTLQLLILEVAIFSGAAVYLFAAKSKKVNKQTFKTHRTYSRIIILIEVFAIALGTLIFEEFIYFAYLGAMAILFQSVSLLPIWPAKGKVVEQ